MATSINGSIVNLEEKKLLQAVLTELTAVRTAYTALLTKLDGEAGLGGGYVSGVQIAAAQLTK